MRWLTPDLVCRDAVELVTDYLEGRLSRRNRRRFKAHIAACLNCQNYLDQIRATMTAAGKIQPEDLSQEAREELVGLFRRYRREP